MAAELSRPLSEDRVPPLLAGDPWRMAARPWGFLGGVVPLEGKFYMCSSSTICFRG